MPKRPKAAPVRIPGWAWALNKWYTIRPKNRGPKPGPKRLPAWFWPWRKWYRSGRPATPAPTPQRVRALRALQGKLGTKESPAGSNRCWASEWYGMTGPWCAMAVSWAYSRAGSRHFDPRRARWAYVPYMLHAARAGDGLTLTSDPRPGDIVMYDWGSDGVPDHTGLFERWSVHGVSFYAIEGNTSYGNDSNGGEVMRRVRSVGSVAGFARVKP